MQPDAKPPDLVPVAVAAVVEKVSSIDSDTPTTPTLGALLAAPPDTLRVLITQRRAGGVLGGYWELPGGKVEPGEAVEQALARELREEVGIDVRALKPLQPVEHAYPHARVRLLPFVCGRLKGLPRTLEVADARWVTLDALGSYRFPEASVPVLDALRACFMADAGGARDTMLADRP